MISKETLFLSLSMQIFRCRLDPLNGESNKTECKDALLSFSRALGGGYFLTILVRLLPLLGAGIDDTSLPLQSLLSDRWELFKSSLVDKGMVIHWPCGPMDKASAYGAGDCRFESYQGHALSLIAVASCPLLHKSKSQL